MQVVKIQFVSWDREYFFDLNEVNAQIGDKVVVKTENSMELGEVLSFAEASEKEILDDKEKGGLFYEPSIDEKKEDAEGTEEKDGNEKEDLKEEGKNENDKIALRKVVRKANMHDLTKLTSAAEKNKALKFAQQSKDKYSLPMKFVDAYFSFDGSKITLAFIADGRVDFRELVKDLTRHFSRTIRLQQIGIRDEAKLMGDYGHCGKKLCCREHLKNLESITSEMAELQQCSHRGAERISGMCGRLMCCLAYEEKGYQELAGKFPPLGRKVSVDGKKGVVVGHHILKGSVDVQMSGEKGENSSAVVEVNLNRNKKK